MISEDDIVKYLRQLPNGNAVALCISFIADTIYPDEDEASIEKLFEFMDEVRAVINKHRQEANNDNSET